MIARARSPIRHRLVFRAELLRQVRETLLADAPLESACFLLARPVAGPGGDWRLVVHEHIPIAPEDYRVRTEVEIELPPEVVAHALQRARASESSLILTHSHPGGDPRPSRRDLRGEAAMLPGIRRRVPAVPHGRLIVSPDDMHAALFQADGSVSRLEAWAVGTDLERFDQREPAGPIAETYDRQVRAFGADGQRTLTGLRVAIVGLGGTGSIVAQQLAHLGVGSFLLFDPDHVEATNLNRVVGTKPSDVGRPKVDVATEMILSINPAAHVEPHVADIRDSCTARALLGADVVMGCTDSHGSRLVLVQTAYQYFVPLIDMGVGIQAGDAGVSHVSGRVQMIAPGLPCLMCTGVLDPAAVRRDMQTDEARAADPYVQGALVPQPAVISINGTASSMAVTMLMSAVAGIPLASRHQRLRLETGVVTRIDASPVDDCPVCVASVGMGDTWGRPGRTLPAPAAMRILST